jgi:hypothetical protein
MLMRRLEREVAITKFCKFLIEQRADPTFTIGQVKYDINFSLKPEKSIANHSLALPSPSMQQTPYSNGTIPKGIPNWRNCWQPGLKSQWSLLPSTVVLLQDFARF